MKRERPGCFAWTNPCSNQALALMLSPAFPPSRVSNPCRKKHMPLHTFEDVRTTVR